AACSDADAITVLASGHASRARRESAAHRSAGAVTTVDVATPRSVVALGATRPAPREQAAIETRTAPSPSVGSNDVRADLRCLTDLSSVTGAEQFTVDGERFTAGLEFQGVRLLDPIK